MSGGRIDTFNATRAIIAATRFTKDSAASESRPTDPVMCQARVFSRIVAMAAAIDNHAKRLRSSGGRCREVTAGMSGIVVTRALSQPHLYSPNRTVNHLSGTQCRHSQRPRDGHAHRTARPLWRRGVTKLKPAW